MRYYRVILDLEKGGKEMDIAYLKDYRFYVKVSAVTIIAGILTLIITQIIKVVLKKKRIIVEGMEECRKDEVLSRIGRIVALITYASFYIGNELYLKHTLAFDGALITGLLTGATLTLTIAKGIYTMLHQWSQKKNIYERLEYAEKAKSILEEALTQECLKVENTEASAPQALKTESKNKWTLTHKK